MDNDLQQGEQPNTPYHVFNLLDPHFSEFLEQFFQKSEQIQKLTEQEQAAKIFQKELKKLDPDSNLANQEEEQQQQNGIDEDDNNSIQQKQELNFEKININYSGSRLRPYILNQIFEPLKDSKNSKELMENIHKVLIHRLGAQKVFPEIYLQCTIDSIKNSENQQQLQKSQEEEQENTQKLAEEKEIISEKKQINLDFILKDLPILKPEILLNKENFGSNSISSIFQLNFKNAFGYLEDIQISQQKNFGKVNPFYKSQQKFSVNVPYFAHKNSQDKSKQVLKFENLQYRAQFTDKNLFLNKNSDFQNILERSFSQKFVFQPFLRKFDDPNMYFQFKQKSRQNIYNNPEGKYEEQINPTNITPVSQYQLQCQYFAKILKKYSIYQDENLPYKTIYNITEEESENLKVMRIQTYAQSLKGSISWNLHNGEIFNTKNNNLFAKMQYRGQLQTQMSQPIPGNQYGQLKFENNFQATGILGLKSLQINDRIKLRNVLGFQEILPSSQLEKKQPKFNLSLENSSKLYILDYPLLQTQDIKPFVHLSWYAIPNFANFGAQKQLQENKNFSVNNSKNNNNNLLSKFNMIRQARDKSGAVDNLVTNFRASAGFGIQFGNDMQLTYNFFNFNGDKYNFDSFSKIQFNINYKKL